MRSLLVISLDSAPFSQDRSQTTQSLLSSHQFKSLGNRAAIWSSGVDFSDAMILAMVFQNVIGLFFLFQKAREELNRYLTAIKNSTS